MRLWSAAAGLVLAAGPAASQTISYEFANAVTGAAQSSFTVEQGSTVAVRVYLREGGGAPTLSSQGGLATAAVRLSFNNPAGVVSIPNTAAGASPAIPPWSVGTTADPLTPPPASTAVLNLASFDGVLPDGDGRILLGTFTLNADAVGTTLLNLSDPDPGTAGNTTLFNSGSSIDSLLAAGSAQVFVVPVPEPAITGLAAAGVLAVVRVRRRAGD